MPIKDNREYRNTGNINTENNYIVEGYASTFDRYALTEIEGITYYEQIDSQAFKDADISDVVFLRDHTGGVLARTKNGAVILSVDTHGLKARADLSLTQAAREMYEDIKTGNYNQMSFSFKVAEDHYDRATRTRVIDKIKKVYDVSAVAFPANPYTEIGLSARDYFTAFIKAEKEAKEKEKREKLRKELLSKIAKEIKK